MSKKMLIDASHAEEIRVAVLDSKNQLEELDFETTTKKTLKGNVYLAKVTRVEPSLQAAFVEYGGNRHGFLPFNEIHPDYFRIPIDDRKKIEEEIKASYTPEPEEEALSEVQPFPIKGRSVSEIKIAESKKENTKTKVKTSIEVDADKLPLTASKEAPEIKFIEEQPVKLVSETSGQVQPLEEEVEIIGGEGTEEFQSRRRKRLSFHDRYKIQEVLHKGQVLLIQVVKEERKTKGAAITTYLSFAGRYCVLMPNSPRSGGVSRKIANIQDRRRLKEVLNSLNVPDSMSLIIRTAGRGLSKPEIKRDYEYLLRLWNKIREVTLSSVAPALIYEEANLIKRAVRDIYTKDIQEVWIQGDDSYKLAKKLFHELMPTHEKRLKHYTKKDVPLFHHFGIEGQVERLYKPEVTLPSGGSLVFNQTEALVAIDINSGRSTRERDIEKTAFNTNLEATEEIARQLRLRDLAGLVVIDFIDMELPENRVAVEEKLKQAMNVDRARIQMGHISHFGLLELSRQRLRPSIIEASSVPCPHCQGTGMIRSMESYAMDLLHTIEGLAIKGKNDILYFRTSSEIANYLLNYKRSEISLLEQYHHARIFIEPDATMVTPHYEMLSANLTSNTKREEQKKRAQAGLAEQKERLQVFQHSSVNEHELYEEREEPHQQEHKTEERPGRKRGRRGGRRQGGRPYHHGQANKRPEHKPAHRPSNKSWWKKLFE